MSPSAALRATGLVKDYRRGRAVDGVSLTVRPGERVAVVPWSYPERRVVLHFFRCRIAGGAPRPQEGQPFRWVTPSELVRLPVPPADLAIITRLTRRDRGVPARLTVSR